MSRNKRIQVGLPPEVHAKVKAVAERSKRTIIAQIEYWADYDKFLYEETVKKGVEFVFRNADIDHDKKTT